MDINVNVTVALSEDTKAVLASLADAAMAANILTKLKVDTTPEQKQEMSEQTRNLKQSEEPAETTIEEDAYTIDDVREALKQLKKKKDTDAATGLLNSLGYDKVSNIPVEEYGKVIEAAQKEAA